jgi:hypothetical protein
MSRKSRYDNQKSKELLAAIVLVIIFIIAFYKYILIVLGTLVIAWLLYVTIKYWILKRNYQKMQYYIDTQIPFKKIYRKKGKRFEIDCYEILKTELKECKILTNLIIPRLNAVNEFAEIDLIVFYNTGIYVLELKDYKGYVYGKKENYKWSVGYSVGSKKNNRETKVYEFQNPIKQNEGHISDLNRIKSYDYKNYVIFSKTMDFNSYIPNVLTIDKFIEIIKSNKTLPQSDLIERESIYELLRKYDLGNDDNIKNQHIMRQQYNNKKYNN